MRIVWLAWKDHEHPLAGGAEVVKEQLCKRLVKDGHEVIVVTGGFAGAKPEITHDGYKIVRVGSRFSTYWHAHKYYKEHLQDWANLVIEEINTVPYMSRWYTKKPTVLMVHQLARQIWFYELIFPLSLVGYAVEPLYLWLLRKCKTITVSRSSKHDLERYGFKDVHIISEGLEIAPLKKLEHSKKFTHPTLLSLGSVRPMKRTIDQLHAFEIAKQHIPDLRLIIAGNNSTRYGQNVVAAAKASKYAKDIEILGPVTDIEKRKLMQQSHLILVTSVKEGWGLIVSEAASQGTPAAVYNVDGLRDSVQNGISGCIAVHNTPAGLAATIQNALSDDLAYQQLRQTAWTLSKRLTFEQSYKDFKGVLGL